MNSKRGSYQKHQTNQKVDTVVLATETSVSNAARIMGIKRKTVEYWMKCTSLESKQVLKDNWLLVRDGKNSAEDVDFQGQMKKQFPDLMGVSEKIEVVDVPLSEEKKERIQDYFSFDRKKDVNKWIEGTKIYFWNPRVHGIGWYVDWEKEPKGKAEDEFKQILLQKAKHTMRKIRIAKKERHPPYIRYS